jgi:MipA family protein
MTVSGDRSADSAHSWRRRWRDVARFGLGMAAVILCSTEAYAQSETETPATSQSQSRAAVPTWEGSIGGVVVATPQYPGSEEYRILPVPIVRITYKGRLFFGPSQTGLGGGIGAYALRTSRLSVAVETGVQDRRPAGRADALAGMEDRPIVASVGATATYRHGPIQAVVGVAKGLNDDAGVLGLVQLSMTRRIRPRLLATVTGSAMFADQKQMLRDFGVTDIEARRRQALIAAGDPRLAPDSGAAYLPETGGLRQAGASVFLVYVLSPRWSAIATAGVDGLSDTAAASPIVRSRAQATVGTGLVWRF